MRALLAGLAVGLSFLLAAGARPAAAADHVVTLTDAPPYFAPQSLEIAVGDTVAWKNVGPELIHGLTDDESRLFAADVEPGQTYRHTFTKAGAYSFVCHRHHFMRGAVTVRAKDGSLVSPPEHEYQRAFTEYPIPTLKSVPRMIIASTVDDSIWFTEGGGGFYGFEDIPPMNKVARLDAHGTMVEYATPTPNGDGSRVGVDSLVMDPSGTVWFTERLTNRIGRLSPDGVIKEFQVPRPDGEALGIDIDAEGRLWIAERFANRITMMTPSGAFTHVDMPSPESEPRTVYVDRRGRVWFTTRAGNEIGYYDPASKTIDRVIIPTALARPTGICETSDGTIYFVEMVGNKIGRLRGNQVTEFPLPTKFAAPFKIVADQNDVLWFTEVFGNAIGRMDPRTGEITEYKIPTPDSRPAGIAVDRKGRVWFTEQLGNKIGMLDPALLPRPETSDGREPGVINFEVPTPGAGPGDDLVEADGWLWFPERFANQLGAIHLETQRFKEFPLPTPASMPVAVDKGPSGALWVAQFRTGSVAQVDAASGRTREFPVGSPASLPSDVLVGDDGHVWVALPGDNAIARLDPRTAQVTQIEMPRRESSPQQLALDDEGYLWVSASEERGNYVARLDRGSGAFEIYALPIGEAFPGALLCAGDAVWVTLPGLRSVARLDRRTGRWTEFKLRTDRSEPVRLARDHRGLIWITDGGGLGGNGANEIVVLDPDTGHTASIRLATRAAKPRGIAEASDGSIWFTQQHANRVSRVDNREDLTWTGANPR
ncbi:MAG: virginiamycin B lyase family protein [Vicinamibacterales bacterium]